MSYKSENMFFSAAYLLFGALGLSTKPVSMARNAAYLAHNLADSSGKNKKLEKSGWLYKKGKQA